MSVTIEDEGAFTERKPVRSSQHDTLTNHFNGIEAGSQPIGWSDSSTDPHEPC